MIDEYREKNKDNEEEQAKNNSKSEPILRNREGRKKTRGKNPISPLLLSTMAAPAQASVPTADVDEAIQSLIKDGKGEIGNQGEREREKDGR